MTKRARRKAKSAEAPLASEGSGPLARIVRAEGAERRARIEWVSRRRPEARIGRTAPQDGGADAQSLLLATMPPSLQIMQGRQTPCTVVAFSLFGQPAERIPDLLKLVDNTVHDDRGLVALCLTDAAGVGSLRPDMKFELMHLPDLGNPADVAAFRVRMDVVWAKWKVHHLVDFSRPGLLRDLLDEPERYLDQSRHRPAFDALKPLDPPASPPLADLAALRAEYVWKGLDKEEDTFAFYRILGNDLPPRHTVGQTLEKLDFILKNERPLEGCSKY